MNIASALQSLGTDEPWAVGFDAGSIALKVVVTDFSGKLLEQSYTRTNGRPVENALEQLGRVLHERGDRVTLMAGTGSAGRLICELLGVPFINEVICQAGAVRRLHPEARTLIEMGGQDSKLIFLPNDPADRRTMVDFAMNTNCAAGTGSFLDQQASRLGVAIEEFSRLALLSASPPRVAGRCSVFAKSDMIHLQQQATPVHEIIAGLCFGLARNLKSNLGRARAFPRPIAFCGGVAANEGVVRAIREVFELGEGELIVPECHAVTGALGAVLAALAKRAERGADFGRPASGRFDLQPLQQHLTEERSVGHRLAPLAGANGNGHCAHCLTCSPAAPTEMEQAGPPLAHTPVAPAQPAIEEQSQSGEALLAQANGKPIDAWLGLDVGSISTKIAIIDQQNRVLAKIYLMTAGRPLEAVQQALREIQRQVRGRVRIRGAATTGSGRYLTGEFIGADLVINEITAQATAAAAIDPEVDTIFEIGGQDSKYIGLDHGVVVDFEMNHACAAGTGSFLEEQAERLGISIKEQFAGLALGSKSPIRLGERCTVFMESDLLSYQQQGAATEDLVAGLCYSIVSNYINRVVGHRRIGQRIFFQGGPAFNQGVVSAFEKFTGCKITVPPHHEVTGSIGAAILARRYQEEHGRTASDFGGFDLADRKYEIRTFTCDTCSNHCEINEVTIAGREPLYHGSRCDRYNLKKDRDRNDDIPNLIAERHRLLVRHANLAKAIPGRPTVGIPLALSNYQLLPFWGTLLGQLGCNVVVSQVSTPKIIQRGVEAVLSTPCFPVKVAHGHVFDLIDRGVDYVWLPSVLSLPREDASARFSQLCPYVTAIPYEITAALGPAADQAKVLAPAILFHKGKRKLLAGLKPLGRQFGATAKQLRLAMEKALQAQHDFEDACRARGRDVLATIPPADGSNGHGAGASDSPVPRAVVIVSRPYNGCDAGVNLDLAGKLRKLGVLAIPMDFLDLRDAGIAGDHIFQSMYWKYGQRILRAGKIIREDPRLNAIYLSNFSCGPDSFLIGYFKRLMNPKPSLVLEVDEHSAGAGVVTRLEAFLESLRSVTAVKLPPTEPLYPPHATNGHRPKLYLPWMGDISHALAAAFRAQGQPAEVMPIGDAETIELGRRYTSGKECLPCIITAGDMIRVTQQPGFDPKNSAFFMPGGSGPCRFGQYHCVHKMILNDLGLPEVPVVSISQDPEFYQQCSEFGNKALLLAWRGSCAFELFQNACMAIRPYETEPGRANAIYAAWRDRLIQFLETRPTTEAVAAQLHQAAADLMAVPVDRSRPRPKIGIVGEIYVRQHPRANNDLVAQLERFGGECVLAGFSEWMYYTNWLRKREARDDRELGNWFQGALKDHVMHRTHRQLSVPFEPILGKFHEPPIDKVLELAAPYLHDSFQGEAILSVGKMIELAHQGCHGVVNAMPFSCMPSTIVAGVMKKLVVELGTMPTLSISFDGQQDPAQETRLEAFIHQARTYQQGAGSTERGASVPV